MEYQTIHAMDEFLYGDPRKPLIGTLFKIAKQPYKYKIRLILSQESSNPLRG